MSTISGIDREQVRISHAGADPGAQQPPRHPERSAVLGHVLDRLHDGHRLEGSIREIRRLERADPDFDTVSDTSRNGLLAHIPRLRNSG